MLIKPDSDYRLLLREELEARCQKNARYSLRAFARDLGVSAPRLSHVLNGKHGLSRAAALQISERLGLNKEEQEYFCDLVDSQHARGNFKRMVAEKRLKGRKPQYQGLEVETFKIISDWYHFALLELTLTTSFKSEPSWIAKALGISVHEARLAIERLKKVEALEERSDGSLRATGAFIANASGVPSEAIRKFYRQFLEKATQSLTFQTVDEREFASLTLAVDDADIPRAKEFIRKLRDEFDAKFSKGKAKNQVYGLGIQLFRLQERMGS